MGVPFGKYELLTKLGTGGMAVTYRAQLKGAAGVVKPVVIKQVLPHAAADELFIEAFIQEAKVCTQLSHANIAQVFDFGQQNGEYFLAMEWVNGRDLDALIDRATEKGFWHLPVPLACFVAIEVLKGLHHAHTRLGPDGRPLDLVHRDVSPDNVLIGFEGEVKLIDFGVAKARLAGRRETEPGMVKGKYLFFSPEQATAEMPLDGRSDVFAVGVMLYRMLAGRFPFEGSMHTVLSQLVRGRYPPLDEVNPDVPAPVAEAVSIAMQMNREHRFRTAAAFGDALSAFLVARAPTFTARDVGSFARYLFAEDIKREGSSPQLPGGFLEQLERWRPPPRPAARLGTAGAGPVPLGVGPLSPTLPATAQPPAVTTSEAPAVASLTGSTRAAQPGIPRWLIGAVVLAGVVAVGLVGGSMVLDAQHEHNGPRADQAIPPTLPPGPPVLPNRPQPITAPPPAGAQALGPTPPAGPVKPERLPLSASVADVKLVVSPVRHHLTVREANDLSTFDLKPGKSITVSSSGGSSLYLLADLKGAPQAVGELRGRLSFKGPGKVRVFDLPDRAGMTRPLPPSLALDGRAFRISSKMFTEGVTGDTADFEDLNPKSTYHVEVRGSPRSTVLLADYRVLASGAYGVAPQLPRLVTPPASFDVKDVSVLSFAFADGLPQDGPVEVLVGQKTGDLDRYIADRACQLQKLYEKSGDAQAAKQAELTCARGAAAIARDEQEKERLRQDEASDEMMTNASDLAGEGKVREALTQLAECTRKYPLGCRCPEGWMQISARAGIYEPTSPVMKRVTQCNAKTGQRQPDFSKSPMENVNQLLRQQGMNPARGGP